MIKKYLPIIFILLLTIIVSAGDYDAPSEFGTDIETTCYIGGINGILNCTGNLTISGNSFLDFDILLLGSQCLIL